MHPEFGWLSVIWTVRIFGVTRDEWFTRNLRKGQQAAQDLDHSHNASRINEPMEVWSVSRTSVA